MNAVSTLGSPLLHLDAILNPYFLPEAKLSTVFDPAVMLFIVKSESQPPELFSINTSNLWFAPSHAGFHSKEIKSTPIFEILKLSGGGALQPSILMDWIESGAEDPNVAVAGTDAQQIKQKCTAKVNSFAMMMEFVNLNQKISG